MKSKATLRVKNGDLVEVISGVHKEKRGKVIEVHAEDGLVLVEGVNMRWKHLRRSQKNPQGGRVEREAPLPASKVMVVSSETDTAQRVRRVHFVGKDKNGKRKAYSYRVGVKDQKPVSARDKEIAEIHAATKG